MKTKAFIIILFTSTTIFSQKFEGLAKTPPMGWNSWNKFACQVDEKLIRETADAMVSSGMKDAGYQYINIDDCWQGKRDSLGFIHPDPERFPSGMKNLADYIHSKGLKFGIYSDAGWKTCGGRAGSRGYEFQDAMTYARWGVDYLKYDWCNTEGLNAEGAYLTMREALYSAGRPIVFSICEWGGNKPWDWGKSIGHLWRTTGDISNCFDCIVDHGSWKSWGVMQILDMQEGLRVHAGPDHWNDPDMMEVGNGMTNNEDRAHFSMWCMLSAPLIAGNDLRNMSESVTNILTNKKVIAVNQDKLGIQAFKHSAEDSLEVWYKPLSDNEWAVCFLNRSTTPKSFEYIWKQKQIEDNFSSRELNVKDIEYNILDLWINNNLGTTNNNLSYEIPAHDVLMVRLIPIP
ncbi:MAG: alpha-galactosidase [Ignavibacteriae bacterium HGW-Ignavibacteriae-2]|jgi:alpha-galactosidase|nr:MAG: alpha-galactosidase [Ignavibacteriae bacterium HGW-Ignavibacteriae-2]